MFPDAAPNRFTEQHIHTVVGRQVRSLNYVRNNNNVTFVPVIYFVTSHSLVKRGIRCFSSFFLHFSTLTVYVLKYVRVIFFHILNPDIKS